MSKNHDVTHILGRVGQGEARALSELIPLVHEELRSLASEQMRGQRPGHTLQPTALVNEAYLKLVVNADRTWQNRKHFLASAAQAMRHILVDHARARSTEKRGRSQRPISLDGVDAPVELGGVEVLDLDDALTHLAAQRPDHARVVELRIFGGLTLPEVAQVLELSERTAARYWRYALARLARVLEVDDEAGC